MAQGDVTIEIATVSNNNYLTIQPGENVEWVIHNISYAGAMELYMYDGSLSVKVDSDSTWGARQCMAYHCTNGHYYRVKNISGGDIVMAYDGIVTK